MKIDGSATVMLPIRPSPSACGIRWSCRFRATVRLQEVCDSISRKLPRSSLAPPPPSSERLRSLEPGPVRLEWFSSLAAQVRFLKHTLRFPCYGDPEYTFSDVERVIQREIVNRNYLARYELRLAEEQQTTDLVLLRQLECKYGKPVGERDQELQPAVPPVDQTSVTPVQGSLF